jgi:NDP-sugar pyrophosphorylase family protein
MKGMVLAAGLGTRLKPLTDHKPKALVEVGGKTLLEITLGRLRAVGVGEVIVNVHHFAEMIEQYLRNHNHFGMRIEISREEVLLDTGGGLKRAGWFFAENGADEPFLLHNVDVLSGIDLGRMVERHRQAGALSTLAVQERETSRRLLFDERMELCGRRTGKEGNAEMARPAPAANAFAFTGIHVISPRMIGMMTEEGVFSIIPTYLRLAGAGEKSLGFRADEYYWRDLGKLSALQQAEEDWRRKLFVCP